MAELHRPKLPLTKFVVGGEAGAAVEAPAAKVSAAEDGFSGEGVKSGEPVLIENTGEGSHHFLASRLPPGKTIADARKFLKTDGLDLGRMTTRVRPTHLPAR